MDGNLVNTNVSTEVTLLDKIKERHRRGKNYTFIGDVLVAVNSFQGAETGGVPERGSEQILNVPHPLTVATSMYNAIIQDKESQCCVIAGETCSGKTEIAKIVLNGLLKRISCEDEDLPHKISMANIILDAFGHARTPLSKNATRFGKFLQLHFSLDGQAISASFSEYLLEKSRVIRQRKEGRNFHMFYYLFSGMSQEELDQSYLGSIENHRYLNFGAPLAESQAENERFRRCYLNVCKSMKNIGFSIEEIADSFQVLSGILNVGNIKFANKDDCTDLIVNTIESVENAASLLGVRKDDLQKALTSITATVDGETITAAKSIAKANSGRDRLGKELYGRLFSWIIAKVNTFIQCPDHKKRTSQLPSIGLLDMFGFEEFETNTFEQLCVNSANEQLHFFFTQHVFAWEKLEYDQEGIDGHNVEYPDNKDIINLLLEKPYGLFALLDEESKYPNADDNTLVSKFNANCIDHEHYSNVSSKRPMFAITHFNGKVHYFVDGFLQKNRGTLNPRIADCLKESNNSVVSALFQGTISKLDLLSSTIRQKILQRQPQTVTRSRRHEKGSIYLILLHGFTCLSCFPSTLCRLILFVFNLDRKSIDSSAAAAKRKQKGSLTTGAQFRNSLVELMEKILQSRPHFIRCIKLNSKTEPASYDDDLIMKQIQGFCLYDTLRVREQGFPIRLTLQQFIERYQFICFPLVSKVSPTKDNVERVLEYCKLSGYKIGKSKIFLKLHHERELNTALRRVLNKVVTVQKVLRGRLARIDYHYMLTNKKHEERTIGNFLMSVKTKPSKMHTTLVNMNKQDGKRYDKEIEESKRKLKDTQKKKMSQKATDGTSLNYRSRRSKDDTYLTGKQSESKKSEKLPVYKGELPLMRDFTRGRLKAWCRIDCYERQFHVASFFLHQSVITIDGSHVIDQSAKIGLCYLPSKTMDSKVMKVKNCIGKGLKLHQDDTGNVWATRIGKNPVFVRGFFLSPELIKLNGKLTQGVPMKIFDIVDFKDNLLQECSTVIKDEQDLRSKLIGTCKVCASFIKDTVVDEETPCWIEVWFVEHVETVRKRLLAVLKMQRKLPQGLAPLSSEQQSSKAAIQETIPEEESSQKEQQVQVIEDRAERKEDKDKLVLEEKRRPQPVQSFNVDFSEEHPMIERDIRTGQRSPHIKIAGDKVVLDYGSSFRPQTYQPEIGSFESELMTSQDKRVEDYVAVQANAPYGLAEVSYPDQEASAMSYGKVFGMNAYDYAFEFVPPTYRRHRRHSDSDSESVRNFMSDNMPIHGILEFEEKKPTPLQPMKWISKKARRKSDDNRRKAFPVR
eukprot:gene12176-13433_t